MTAKRAIAFYLLKNNNNKKEEQHTLDETVCSVFFFFPMRYRNVFKYSASSVCADLFLSRREFPVCCLPIVPLSLLFFFFPFLTVFFLLSLVHQRAALCLRECVSALSRVIVLLSFSKAAVIIAIQCPLKSSFFPLRHHNRAPRFTSTR